MMDQSKGGLPEGEFAEVMAGIEKAAPLLRALSGQGEVANVQEAPSGHGRHRALLCALKPYLSASRCEAADYLLRLWQMGELIQNITREG